MWQEYLAKIPSRLLWLNNAVVSIKYLVSCPVGGVWGRRGTLRLQAGAVPAAPSHKRALFALPGWALTREGITGDYPCNYFGARHFQLPKNEFSSLNHTVTTGL